MPLHKISEFDPDYSNTIQGKDIKGMGVYSQTTNEKIGTVSDVLVDDQGAFRYLIVELGFWIFGKKVLLPLGRSRIDSGAERVYVSMTKEQAEGLPEYREGMAVDYDYEEQVRGGYRTQPLETSAPLDATKAATVAQPTVGRNTSTYDRNSYTYNQEPDLYDVSAHEDQTFKLYEERLIASKQRRKAGEVTIGKHVETETAKVAVPVEKERVIVERVTPDDAGRAVAPGEANFREGEVTRMEIYEETPDIRKEAVVREEVRVRKIVDQETVQAQETVRREELDIDNQGRSIVDRTDRV
ncbi:DUF2382 domain-containing protein [Iningainema tapete]|uniref:DUF2382 domain-containing protein n=1 Tax=Iningainema tapete BLCC-T55 TaxID=2748662 RepID=A0A8J6XNA1_9CYAN|nr:DUF2382 domain-containing protein [Iningainema tapete]MBD2775009.1 DUF2382 domain-containing protein [Iningainema tapete BLCC-T55]